LLQGLGINLKAKPILSHKNRILGEDGKKIAMKKKING